MRLAPSLASLLLGLTPCLGQTSTSPTGEVPLISRSVATATVLKSGVVEPASNTSSKPDNGSFAIDELFPRSRADSGSVHSDGTERDEFEDLRNEGPSASPISGLHSAGRSPSTDVSPLPEGPPPVPEPSTLLLVGTGLVGVALTSRWRKRRQDAD